MTSTRADHPEPSDFTKDTHTDLSPHHFAADRQEGVARVPDGAYGAAPQGLSLGFHEPELGVIEEANRRTFDVDDRQCLPNIFQNKPAMRFQQALLEARGAPPRWT